MTEPAGHDLATLRDIEQRALWLATRIIDHANRRSKTDVKVGGHQASCASMASIMTALWFNHIGGEDKIAVKPPLAGRLRGEVLLPRSADYRRAL